MLRITRYRMLLMIWMGIVMALFCVVMILPWYCLEWCSRVLGFNVFTRIQEGRDYPDAIAPVVFVALAFIPAEMFSRWVRREKRAFAQGKRPCLHCGYDLQGHESVGTCSECGTPFDIAEIDRYFTNLSDSGRRTSVKRGSVHRGSA